MRGMEILQNLGCDIRILELDGDAKDPDEYVIKYGSGRFERCVENAISLVEFKVKTLKKNMTIQTASDKIKFLNEIVKILSKVDNSIEREIYIDKISNEYGISKEAIYAEYNKISNIGNQGIKALQRPIAIKRQNKNLKEDISEGLIKRENMIISLLINSEINAYNQISKKISPKDFKLEVNNKIASILYEHFEKGNSNNNVLDLFKDEELIGHITSLMADDYEITNNEKAIEDLLKVYEKEKLQDEKGKILRMLDDDNIDKDKKLELEKELSNLIIKIAKMK